MAAMVIVIITFLTNHMIFDDFSNAKLKLGQLGPPPPQKKKKCSQLGNHLLLLFSIM